MFNPDTVIDKATIENPNREYAVGFEYVLVSGKVVIDPGKYTGARPDAIL